MVLSAKWRAHYFEGNQGCFHTKMQLLGKLFVHITWAFLLPINWGKFTFFLSIQFHDIYWYHHRWMKNRKNRYLLVLGNKCWLIIINNCILYNFIMLYLSQYCLLIKCNAFWFSNHIYAPVHTRIKPWSHTYVLFLLWSMN